MLNVLSLGWGVQSFTLAAMSCLGLLPKLDVAVYAETHHEKQATYAFMEKWMPWLEDHGLFVAVVDNDSDNNYVNRFNRPEIPAFSQIGTRSGQLRRQCTQKWKVEPIRRFLQEERITQQVKLWLGITIDEFTRMRDSRVSYIVHHYPFIELDWSREDCVEWLLANNFDVPPRSACIFCPYTHLDDWREMKKNRPAEWSEALEVDETIRNIVPGAPSYLNRHFVPLSELDDPKYTPKYALDEQCDSGHCFL